MILRSLASLLMVLAVHAGIPPADLQRMVRTGAPDWDAVVSLDSGLVQSADCEFQILDNRLLSGDCRRPLEGNLPCPAFFSGIEQNVSYSMSYRCAPFELCLSMLSDSFDYQKCQVFSHRSAGFAIGVSTPDRRQGIGSAVWDALVRLARDQGRTRAQVDVYRPCDRGPGTTEGEAFLRARGWSLRHSETRFDLALPPDAEILAALDEQARASSPGYRIRPWSGETAEPDRPQMAVPDAAFEAGLGGCQGGRTPKHLFVKGASLRQQRAVHVVLPAGIADHLPHRQLIGTGQRHDRPLQRQSEQERHQRQYIAIA